jgi:hypothetical protein
MIYEVEFQITPAMTEHTIMKALCDEPYNVDVLSKYSVGWINVECSKLDDMRDKLNNLANHIEQADTSKVYVIDFVFKVEMTF